DRPGPAQGRPDRAAGRGDRRARPAERGGGRRGAGLAARRAHRAGHRAPAGDGPRRRPDPGAAGRPDPRTGAARRAARRGRPVRRVLAPPLAEPGVGAARLSTRPGPGARASWKRGPPRSCGRPEPVRGRMPPASRPGRRAHPGASERRRACGRAPGGAAAPQVRPGCPLLARVDPGALRARTGTPPSRYPTGPIGHYHRSPRSPGRIPADRGEHPEARGASRPMAIPRNPIDPPPGRRRPARPPSLTAPGLAAPVIADAVIRVGFDDLTVAAVAEELKVNTATLYRYVSGRNELIAMGVDRILSRLEWPAPAEDWRAYLEANAWTLWRTLSAHR